VIHVLCATEGNQDKGRASGVNVYHTTGTKNGNILKWGTKFNEARSKLQIPLSMKRDKIFL
jgi:hypothetical protein